MNINSQIYRKYTYIFCMKYVLYVKNYKHGDCAKHLAYPIYHSFNLMGICKITNYVHIWIMDCIIITSFIGPDSFIIVPVHRSFLRKAGYMCRIWGSHSGGYEDFYYLVPCLAHSLTLKMEATHSSETSVSSQRTTRPYTQEDRSLLDYIYSAAQNILLFDMQA
jgi:hypothetical protein